MCLPTCGAALVRIDRPLMKPWAAGCVGSRCENVLKDPVLRRGQVAVRGGELADAARFFRAR